VMFFFASATSFSRRVMYHCPVIPSGVEEFLAYTPS
jgi:hypothetical protein